MYRSILFLHLLLWTPAVCAVDGDLSFNRDIRPILSDTCFFCHGPDPAHREADLRLDIEADAKDHAIVPGNLEESELIARITSSDADELMPPPESGKKLSPQQIELLKQWIAAGAPYEAYWAYVPPVAQPTPQAGDASWPLDPLDNFVSAKRQQQNVPPATDTDPTTLIRRVTFDLTGLPPSQTELDRFLADPSRRAYRDHVDRLLASPAFGERMAIYWLDLVRFADTVGYHGDQDHKITPYRDYVIDAFNDNMPFDQFTREQLAGDLLADATTEQIVATGYNRLLQTSHEGGVQPKEYLAIYAADRIRNLSAVWMGATVGCAQCHDHKYDPFTSKDFYSLVAFFADVDEAQHFKIGTNSLPTKRAPEIAVLSRWQRQWLADVERQLETIGEDDPQQLQSLTAIKERLEKSKRETMVTQSIQPREIRVLPRGNWLDDSGPIVQPTVPEFMRQLDVGDRRANRLDLANWLVDDKNGVGGLTARVFVNRFWYLTFGRGISSSLGDFGGQGQPPTHPQLLDQLAVDFIASGWDVKAMMRRLVLSRTYRQSSDARKQQLADDPYNQWFARQSRYRLAAEMVRDNLLSLSGLLVRDVGGASVKPHQPPGYYRHLNFPQRSYLPDRGAAHWRRGVYVHWQRQYLHPMLKAFDAPSREECTAQRPRSNTPLEALVLLNDHSMIEAAVAMAARILATEENDADRIRTAFRLATSRWPDAVEIEALRSLLDQQRAYYTAHPDDAEAIAGSAAYAKTADPIELAAWTAVTRAILNLYETVARY